MKRINETAFFILDTPLKKNAAYYIKKIEYFCYATLCKFLLLIHPRKRNNQPAYHVAVCAIFKNEALYLKEWIEFHILAGIEHFYLYNNNSDDNFREIFQKYVKAGVVEIIEWPQNQAQMEAYKDCIRKFSQKTEWLGFIDIDEFVVPKKCETVYEFLRRFDNRPAVEIYWKMFGTAGKIERDPSNLVTEDFTVCWNKYVNIGKCFYNTKYRFDFQSSKNNCLHHSLWTKIGIFPIPPVNIEDHMAFGSRHIVHTDEAPIQINHYFTKSYEEYSQKKAKGDVYFQLNPHDEEYFYQHEMKCGDVDYSAYKFLIKLKNAVKD